MTLSSGARNFASMLRNSKFITQGDFRGATVIGKVFHITNQELYVDMGLKFHAVVKKPQKDSNLYVRGSTVRLELLDYEITDRFIGSEKDTSLLEADAILLGLESTPIGRDQTNKSSN